MGLIDAAAGFLFGNGSSVTIQRSSSVPGAGASGLGDFAALSNESAIQLDAGIRELHAIEGAVSDHPVEEGIDVVDNYRVLPRAIEIEGIVSDTPLTTGVPFGTTINAVGAALAGDEKPSITAFENLNKFFNESVVVDITTSLDRYKSMVITSLMVDRDKDNANWLHFVLNAREIRFVTTESNSAFGIAKISQGTGEAGKRVPKVANAAEEAKSKSLLAKLLSF